MCSRAARRCCSIIFSKGTFRRDLLLNALLAAITSANNTYPPTSILVTDINYSSPTRSPASTLGRPSADRLHSMFYCALFRLLKDKSSFGCPLYLCSCMTSHSSCRSAFVLWNLQVCMYPIHPFLWTSYPDATDLRSPFRTTFSSLR